MGGCLARRAAAAAAAVAVLVSAAACGIERGGSSGPSVAATPAPIARTGVPTLRVDVVARGLAKVQDIGFLPDGQMLISQLGGRMTLLSGDDPGASVAPVAADLGDVWVRGEAGLMGLAVHRDFPTSRRFTTCQSHADKGLPTDIRLVTWELATDGRSARRVVDPLVGGIPISSTGRHAGCRPTIASDGALLVGTGDSARPAVAQDLASLGGKVLRIDLGSGGPPLGNPFAQEPNPALQLVLTYGHANVSGLAVDPVTGTAFSADTGSGRVDEINKLVPGQNYGWDPSRGGANYISYDVATPATDLVRYPKAVAASWSSGAPVPVLSGAAFVEGPQWGDLNGRLAVTSATGKKLLIMTVGPDGKVGEILTPAPLDQAFGQLSSVRRSPSGDLYVTTTNGTDDKILRITPT